MPSDKKFFFRGLWSLVCFSWSAVFFTLLFVFGLCCGAAHADFAIKPSISVSEEYNDNIFETNDKKSDYISSVLPGITWSYNAPFWDWDLSYLFAYRYFARKSQNDDFANALQMHGLTRLIDDFLFLDLSDNYGRVSLDIARDRTQESTFVDQSDTNNFTASPYLLFHPATKMTMKTGYRYINIWYKDPTAINRTDQVGFMEATYGLSPNLNLTANYTYTYESSIDPFNRHDPNVGFRYEYKKNSSIFGQGGYTWFSSKNGGISNNPFWNAGIIHSFDHFTVNLASGVQYPFDPENGLTRETDYSLTVRKDFTRGFISANVSYSKYLRGGNSITVIPIENQGGRGVDVDIKSRYSGGISASHELLQYLNATLSGSFERYEHSASDTYTRRIYVSSGLTYKFPKEINIALNYNFIDSHSPIIPTDSYTENRVILMLSKSFGKLLERQQPVDIDRRPGTSDN